MPITSLTDSPVLTFFITFSIPRNMFYSVSDLNLSALRGNFVSLTLKYLIPKAIASVYLPLFSLLLN